MKYPIIDGINSPSDLKKLNKSEIPTLAKEIREFLIDRTEKNGGHLASNLGVVELTLAIHTVFDSPSDHIIFDVGHQSYVHKLLTGRREAFETLRKPGGLSGFTRMAESEHDAFGAGHSSTSVSAALGLAEADALAGNKCHTICVMGDGAYTGGMIHEALNNCRPELPMIIILNENGMSISSNKGAFASYLAKVRVSSGYRNLKSKTQDFLEKLPLVGTPLRDLFSLVKRGAKRLLYTPNYFDELGLYYLGPIDGHDYDTLTRTLELAKQTGQTCVVHVKTVKGKGYSPAENSPDGYHSVYSSSAKDTYHSVFADELISLADKNDKILAVTAAMGIGTGLNAFGEKYPERYFDVGIAEAHALTFSAGLAARGYKPFVAVYSTFLQRGYDSLLHDIALQKLPVKLMIDRAGLAPGDGATHHGIFDVSFISHIPEMMLLAPASYSSLRDMTAYAATSDGPIAIRYPNASEMTESISGMKCISESVTCRVYADFDVSGTPEYIFITYGSIVSEVRRAEEAIKSKGFSCGTVLVETLKPYAAVAEVVSKLICGAKRVLYVEEGIKNGGAAEITLAELSARGFDFNKTEYRIAAIDDSFATPESLCDLYDYVGLSAKKLEEKMCK
ncbi:MAG: 1-deoxy-D-xylulose-5-phosphate synthase [Clostridia bacterium]|nr:1-deoxy-D-xylulose-5-phosphate synthase [Clostridia bacterium]